MRAMATEAKLLIVQFLTWIETRPRTRDDVQDVWQSTCPLNSAWEDAICNDLVAFAPEGHVVLTDQGRDLLNKSP
jgi:hypothetical protein